MTTTAPAPLAFDLVVVGSGTAASTVAKRCAAAGQRVAVVEEREIGGTCALRGCDPKRVLLGAAEIVDHARRLQGRGLSASPRIDWPALMAFKRSFTRPVPSSKTESFEQAGIEVIHGHARFGGPDLLLVESEEGAPLRLHADRIHLATGARPMPLGIEGEEHLATSDQFLELDELPARIVFVGAGYISMELAHLARTAGAEVRLLEQLPDVLPAFDEALVALLLENAQKLGVEVRRETGVSAIEAHDEGFTVRASHRDEQLSFEADLVVHGAGRVPHIDGLDLDAGNVRLDEGGIAVDTFLRSVTNPRVTAAGDATRAGMPLTPVAGLEADIVAENLAHGVHRPVIFPATPHVVFTLPPLASVGQTEREARTEHGEVKVTQGSMAEWYPSRRQGHDVSGFKLILHHPTGRILGAHVFGPGADELINVLAVAMRGGLRAQDLRSTLFAYPTAASDLDAMLGD